MKLYSHTSTTRLVSKTFGLLLISLSIQPLNIFLQDKNSSLVNLNWANFLCLLLALLFLLTLKKHKFDMASLGLLIILIFSCQSIITNPTVNTPYLLGFLRGWLMVFALYHLRHHLARISVIHGLIALSMIGASLGYAQAYQFITGGDVKFGLSYNSYMRVSDFNKDSAAGFFRISPMAGDPNYYAALLVPGLLAVLTNQLRTQKSTLIILCIFLMPPLVLSQSRSSILALVCASLFYFLKGAASIKRFAVLSLLAALSISLGALFLQMRPDSSGSDAERLALLLSSLQKLDEYLFFGSGIGNFVIDNFGSAMTMESHNTFLDLWLYAGVFCFLSFCFFFFITFFSSGDKYFKSVAVFIAVNSLFLSNLMYLHFWLFLFLFIFFIRRDDNSVRQRNPPIVNSAIKPQQH